MKHLFTAMLFAGFLAGCGIDYDGATKIVFEGTVTAPDGSPLEGIKVSTHLSNSFEHDTISYDFTDSNGQYLMIFPKPDESVDIEVEINESDAANGLSATSVVNINLSDAVDFRIDFGSQALFEVQNSVALHINIPDNLSVRKIALTGLVSNNIVDNNFNSPPDPNENCVITDYLVARNQVITLKYLLANGSVRENQITIGEEDVTHTLQ